MMRFGYGLGIAYPPIWLEPLTIAKGFDTRLKPGMVFVAHSCLELVDEGLGVIQGGTYLLEPDWPAPTCRRRQPAVGGIVTGEVVLRASQIEVTHAASGTIFHPIDVII